MILTFFATLSIASFENFDQLRDGGSNCDEPIDTDIGVYWQNVDITDGQQAVFRVNAGSTPSPNTGPTADHTLGRSTGKYIYLEASSSCNPNVPWHFESSIRYDGASDSPSLSLWYHQVSFRSIDRILCVCTLIKREKTKYGTIGAWSVSFFDGTTLTTPYINAGGNEGQTWQFVTIPLPASDNITIIFEGN